MWFYLHFSGNNKVCQVLVSICYTGFVICYGLYLNCLPVERPGPQCTVQSWDLGSDWIMRALIWWMDCGMNPLMNLSLGDIIGKCWKLGSRACWGKVDDQKCILENTLSLDPPFYFHPECCEVPPCHSSSSQAQKTEPSDCRLRPLILWVTTQLLPLLWLSQIQ